jgi:hypothetical protein
MTRAERPPSGRVSESWVLVGGLASGMVSELSEHPGH